MSRQCRSKVELIQLGSAHEKYGVWTRPELLDFKTNLNRQKKKEKKKNCSRHQIVKNTIYFVHRVEQIHIYALHNWSATTEY